MVRFNRGGTNDYLGGIVNWDPLHSLYTTNGGCHSPATGLAHELAHTAGEDASPGAFNARVGTFDRQYDNLEERRVITGAERSVNRMLGEMPRFDHSANVNKGARGISRTSVYSPVIGVCP